MPYRFSRGWRNFERVFPPQGDFLLPDHVNPGVSIVFDPLARLFTSGSLLRSARHTQALNAGTNDIDLNEPLAGMIQYPVALNVMNPDGAARTTQVVIVNTTNAQDSWGRYDGSVTGGITVEQASIAGGTVVSRMHAVSVPRGNRLRVTMLGMTGGNNAIVDYIWIEIPGEIIALADMAHDTGV